MDHFLNLARRGKPGTGASGGELAARRLALAMLDNASSLDDRAIAGAAEFLQRVWSAPSSSRELIDADGPEAHEQTIARRRAEGREDDGTTGY
ncbi:MAG TPA: hypothetical protein VG269_26710 [Tepidisphaeraceae bacterium]|jgi:hypothetical protein|nr:hypothetical protein [Tepidisphaeraceae bacterium]